MDAPQIIAGYDWVINAWIHLQSTRVTGFGIGPVPWDKIEEYGDRHYLDEDQRDDLHYLIPRMDAVADKEREKLKGR